MSCIEVTKDKNIVNVTLNRPQVRNALNDQMMQEAITTFLDLNQQPNISAIVIRGKGKSFCAGGDISWMKSTHQNQNRPGLSLLVETLKTIEQCPHPVIGRVHGHVIGGGIGLMAVCDLVASTNETRFAFSEVKIGLIPAVISVFILNKISGPHCLEMMLTGEMFGTDKFLGKGLLHFVGTQEQVDQYVAEQCHRLSTVGPQAVKHTKALVKKINGKVSDELLSYALDQLQQVRSSQEAQEGMAAFLEKRKARWP